MPGTLLGAKNTKVKATAKNASGRVKGDPDPTMWETRTPVIPNRDSESISSETHCFGDQGV